MGIQEQVTACRACGLGDLVSVLELGTQALTGVFPRSKSEAVGSGPLTLLWCRGCTLLQLSVNYPSDEMYGTNYGYRSGLNESMIRHLNSTVRNLQRRYEIPKDGVVLDIGSNDGTTLKAFAGPGLTRIGIDPTAEKFAEFYAPTDIVVPDFFSAENFFTVSDRKANVITSISMFYDLPDPVSFTREVRDSLAADGVWLLEQSYMPSMLRQTSYDTICHEHIEYYSLQTLEWILAQADLKVIDVRFNKVNGGSFAATVAHQDSRFELNAPLLDWFRGQEQMMHFNSPAPFREFESRVFRHAHDLRDLIVRLVDSGKVVMGLGASTKGNVLLQFCGLGPELISAIADVNSDKFGAFTPGTRIPIISEADAREMRPDYFLVLPWHFREGIIDREKDFLAKGGGLIFPLPEIEIVGA